MYPQQEPDTILNRMTASLKYKIDQRCADLTVLFDRGTKKELHAFYPLLIESIFGPQGTISWGLRTLLPEYNANEFTILLNFMKPMGPLFKLIYSLLQDPSIKYEFSLAFLPLKVRQMLEGNNMHPFYHEVLQYNPSTKQNISLLLNPFDYYMFHFAYHLINPCQQRMTSEDQWNSVYYNLCVEYLLHFFPLDADSQILPHINFYTGKNPIQSPQMYIKPPKQTHLLKANLFGDPQVQEIKPIQQLLEKHPRNEIWRSETFIMAFLDFWLSNDQVCLHYDSLNMSLCQSSHLELPSADYIRIIRVVVKHLHAFVSSASHDPSSLGELKKITLPMIQSRMYIFLRNLLHRWPLDESFRLVLELWLSFIQPWRYCHEAYAKRGGLYKSSSTQIQLKDETKYPDEEYLPFVTENLLSYVVIFQQLLPRFTRIDLASPKNAQMLFRLTKVFSQQNLVPMIQKIESIIESKNFSPNHSYNASQSFNMPPLSPTSRWSTNTSANIYDSTHIETPKRSCQFEFQDLDLLQAKYLTVIRQKIYELEGPYFCYKPLFTSAAAAEVYELLQNIKMAEIKAHHALIERQQQEKASSGFFAFFTTSTFYDKISLVDRQKAPMFLRCATEYILEIFKVQDFNNFEVDDVVDSGMEMSDNNSGNFADVMRPENVRQRMKLLRYEGDPDLAPVRSDENQFLVRMLYALTKRFNESHGHALGEAYQTSGFLGRILRNVIEPPLTIYTYKRTVGRSQRVASHLPPRLSLRRYAKHKFLATIIFGTLILFYFGYNSCAFIFLYFLLNLGVLLLKSAFTREPSRLHEYSFDDTME